MRPVIEGDRGPAVEDIQRRLLALDYEIGPTGVDGVFLGATLVAVEAFQESSGLPRDGVVGPETWAALVDATFSLGDRLLYLRFPYLHGRDVSTLQRTLSTMGFPVGDIDGIFGAFTEQAVRDFQRNVGGPPDGIVGAETVTALMNLRHIWEGREGGPSPTTRLSASRAADVLKRVRISITWEGAPAAEVAQRVQNLARASTPDSNIDVAEHGIEPPEADVWVTIAPDEAPTQDGIPTVAVTPDSAEAISARLVAALRSHQAEAGDSRRIHVGLDTRTPMDEQLLQVAAVGLLDGLCAGLA